MTTAMSNRRHLTQQQQQPSFIINFLAWLLNAALDIAQWAASQGERLLTEYQVLQWIEEFLLYCTRRPIAAVILGVATVVCGVPIFVFACFAVISSFITFTGFLFIEGTLLTVGFGLLLSFLLVFGCLTLGLFAAGAAAYLGLQRLRSILNAILVYTQSQKGAKLTD